MNDTVRKVNLLLVPYSNSRELIRGESEYQISFLLPVFQRPKKSFKTLKFDILQGQILIWIVAAFEARRTDNTFAKKISDFKGGKEDRGAAVLVSCAKTVRRDAENSEALCTSTQNLLHCEFFRIPCIFRSLRAYRFASRYQDAFPTSFTNTLSKA